MDNNMVEKLKSMLENPEALNAVSSLLGNIQPSAPETFETVEEEAVSASTPVNQVDSINKISQILSETTSTNDPRISLLNSLKPYMGKKRSAKADQAIRLIQIAKMASMFKL
ncbi:MAG: hypothetical protein IKB50_00195 [Clostridia bacterium]|nr:hypothetical protein [Clostridia bacterium]